MKAFTKKIICAGILFLIGGIAPVAAGGEEALKYEPHGKRDPFVSLIDQDKNAAARLIDVTSPEDLKLEGVAVGGAGKKTAIINGEIVKEGQKVGEIEIKTIANNSVELLVSGKPYSLKLPEEGGAKSE